MKSKAVWPVGLSKSPERAMAMFNLPDIGRSTVQEDAGVVDQPLRDAIKAAEELFWRLYVPKPE